MHKVAELAKRRAGACRKILSVYRFSVRELSIVWPDVDVHILKG